MYVCVMCVVCVYVCMLDMCVCVCVCVCVLCDICVCDFISCIFRWLLQLLPKLGSKLTSSYFDRSVHFIIYLNVLNDAHEDKS